MLSRRKLIFGAFSSQDSASQKAADPEQSTATGSFVVAFAEHCLAFQNVVCRSCGESCEHNAIRFQPRLGGASHPSLITERCTGCGDCMNICPNSALSLVSAPVSASASPAALEPAAEFPPESHPVSLNRSVEEFAA